MKVLTPEQFVEYCKGELLAGNEMFPTVFAVRKEESVAAFIDPACPSGEMLHKALAVAGASLVDAFNGHPPELLMFGRETWMSKQTKVPPSEDPKRREGLLISVAHFKAKQFYALAYEVSRKGGTVDLFLTRRWEEGQFRDSEMLAVGNGLVNAAKGTAPDGKGLHVLKVTPGKEPS